MVLEAGGSAAVGAQDNAALLDNVSEESVELELPPPMVELQALPTASAVTTSASVENEGDKTKKPEGEGENGGSQVSSRSPSTLNLSTMAAGELQVVLAAKKCIIKCLVVVNL